MRNLLSAMLMSAFFVTPAVAQDTSPVVVELFTSQGCSSCPPADEILADLAGRDDVIALALHVDYWDYIGWKDEFADPMFTERQKAYAMQAGARSIYTPQFVVGGVNHVVGAEPMQLADQIRDTADLQGGAELSISRSGDTLRVQAVSAQSFAKALDVVVVSYVPNAEVEIESGENAGKTVEYHNIVQSWDDVADWAAQAPLDLSMTVDTDNPIVVLLQEQGPGVIVAAAQVD